MRVTADAAYIVTGDCEMGCHDECCAWTRPYQLAEFPCDCECHMSEGREVADAE